MFVNTILREYNLKEDEIIFKPHPITISFEQFDTTKPLQPE